MLRIPPHFVRPLKTTVSRYSKFSELIAAPLQVLRHNKGRRGTERGAIIVKLRLSIYDTFSRDNGTVPRYQFRGRKRSLQQPPKLNPAAYTATYFHASVHSPKRLALDAMLDDTHAKLSGSMQATGLADNYVEALAMTGHGVTLRDHEIFC